MVLKHIFFHRNSLLALLILVLMANLTLYHTAFGVSSLPENPNGVVVGSIIDLALITPLLFVAWKQNWNVKNIIVAIATGLVLVRFLIPIEYLKPFVAVTWMGFAVEGGIVLLEVSLIFILVKYLPTIIRSVKNSSLPTVFSFPDAIDKHIKSSTLIKIISSEMLMFYYAFASWNKAPNTNMNSFTIHKNSSLIAMQIMLIHSIVLETIVIHWWIHERFFILSVILLILNVYSIIFFIGNLQAIRHNAIQINEKSMYISFGIMKRIKINWDNIEEIMDDPEILKNKLPKNTIDFIARDFEDVYPHVILKLKKPTKAQLLFGLKKEFEYIAIRLDEPSRFKEVLMEKAV
ncbi:beta-carotene 15,15'-monooxygenase [Pseudogracilibacillus sp. SE30717A]|uniref:beta-carotene 15,15'-monooxygenase n=1 Tax=Pseudogracilibacillus sp. SE30717A TaxID=3098293 RepID=UPI00300E67D5